MSTFTISSTTATFKSTIADARQNAADVQELTVGIYLTAQSDWVTFESLVTTKYHVHLPLGGTAIVDIVRGPGAGTLVIDGLGTTTAVLSQLQRGTYLPNARSTGTATFLVTGTPL